MTSPYWPGPLGGLGRPSAAVPRRPGREGGADPFPGSVALNGLQGFRLSRDWRPCTRLARTRGGLARAVRGDPPDPRGAGPEPSSKAIGLKGADDLESAVPPESIAEPGSASEECGPLCFAYLENVPPNQGPHSPDRTRWRMSERLRPAPPFFLLDKLCPKSESRSWNGVSGRDPLTACELLPPAPLAPDAAR